MVNRYISLITINKRLALPENKNSPRTLVCVLQYHLPQILSKLVKLDLRSGDMEHTLVENLHLPSATTDSVHIVQVLLWSEEPRTQTTTSYFIGDRPDICWHIGGVFLLLFILGMAGLIIYFGGLISYISSYISYIMHNPKSD
jgi:hypothetical protein